MGKNTESGWMWWVSNVKQRVVLESYDHRHLMDQYIKGVKHENASVKESGK